MIDTFAWIEYFAGSKKGERAKSYVEGGEAITPTIVIAEFTDKYVREKMNPKERLKFIRTKSAIAVLDDDIAEMAGTISAERRAKVKGWGLVDSVVLATARVRGVKVVTGDEHFKDLGEAITIDGEATGDLVRAYSPLKWQPIVLSTTRPQGAWAKGAKLGWPSHGQKNE